MQIRLTVLRPRSGPAVAGSVIPSVDVLVTAPVGTALGAVAGALAGAVGVRGPRAATHVHLYAGARRVDEHALIGHPPLLDGAVLSLGEPDPSAADDDTPDPAAAELRVTGGPDAGGVHRLHGHEITVGRSSEADVPLDDPDVSRLHLALHLATDGTVTVRDLGSTNGTTLDGRFVSPEEAVPLGEPGLLRLGESTLQVSAAGAGEGPGPAARSALPDGLGHLQLSAPLAAKPAQPAPEPPTAPEAPAAGRARALLSRRLGLGSAPADAGRDSAAQQHSAARTRQAANQRERWPDPATLLLNALGPGPRLWERGPTHPDALTLRLGTGDRPGGPGTAPGTLLPAVPVTLDLQTAGSLGLAGPRARLDALTRAVVAQLAALHPPTGLSLVVVDADAARPPQDRADTWAWALWLPHLRPQHGQDCRLLLGLDDEQAAARLTELTTRLAAPDSAAGLPATVVLVDGVPGTEPARQALELLLRQGPAVGVFPVCLAERPELLPAGLGATAVITGEVGTHLTVDRPVAGGRETVEDVSLDAVSDPWAERLARVLAPLREATPATRGPLPESLRLLDLLQLDSVTPAKLSARWQAAPTGIATATALIGTTRDELCAIDLADPELTLPSPDPGGPHLLVGGAKGAGKTELLRSLIASLAVSERPDRLAVTVIEGRAPADGDDQSGLRGCTELPHVTGQVNAAADPRQALLTAEALLDELTLREQLFDGLDFASWHAARILDGHGLDAGGPNGHDTNGHGPGRDAARSAPVPALSSAGLSGAALSTAAVGAASAPAGTVPAAAPAAAEPGVKVGRPRNGSARPPVGGPVEPPARLIVAVDDYEALLAPTSPAGRPLARALAAVAQRGGPLGIHLVVTTGQPEETAGTEVDEAALLRIALRTEYPSDSDLLIHLGDAAALDEDTPGRGYLRLPDGGVSAFQTARISGRIPRTATLRPTVVAIDPAQLGAPPSRRPVRELGNGPTDLALLASALQRAAAR
ncbi:FtsK/SpoIIIE domain-containing protein [Kitasatospora sp. NBC_00240]|uniref:FHA domain-containing protein n=1 Tax=Kitasatospora sp. NBC_00240 TaxID=2903567 RepID=UPI00224DE76C|nr:FHA domain-containing protein [Kitasatospora sp. NBC_00240]MCX5212643.1 FtsK/SpoIIIE domain-containing protein [Kitasatospora sp. NBC_00240]